MRAPSVALLALAAAGGMLAQEPAAPSGKFYGPLILESTAPKTLSFNNQSIRPPASPVLLQPAASRCAVPLIEMQAPKAADPAIDFGPHLDKVVPMPQAKLPPACDAPSAGSGTYR